MTTGDETLAGIDSQSKAYAAMSEFFALADDLMGGTLAMKKAGAKWLPQFEGEAAKEYTWRLNNAVLKKMLDRAADLLIGHMMREGLDRTDLKLDEHVVEDFDRLGTSIDQYAAKVARYILTHGMAHTFTDFPRVNGSRDVSDELTGGVRPYAIFINPTDLKFAVPKYVNGAALPIDARWHITGEEADGLGDISYREIRRWRWLSEDVKVKVGNEVLAFGAGDVIYEVWRALGDTDYAVTEAGLYKGLQEIPLRTAYADFQGFMRSIPILDGVAQKNREHWRASSDHNSIVQMSRFPMFYMTGVTEEEAKTVNILGPNIKLASTNEQAKFGYAEPSGAAVEQSFKDLERISRDAEQESIEALYKAGSDTATGRKIDLIESLSPAQRAAKETERHMNQVLGDFGKWMGKDVGTIAIDLDFGFSENEQMIIDALQKARALGDISRKYYLQRMQELGVIGDNVKADQLAADADNEQSERGLASQFGQGGTPAGDEDDAEDESNAA